MVLNVLRALFIVLMAAVGWFYIQRPVEVWGDYTWLVMVTSLAVGIIFVVVDVVSSRKKLVVFSGVFFGLIVGVAIAYALSFVVRLLVEQWQPSMNIAADAEHIFYARRDTLREFVNMLLGVVSCYLSISFILQTKDDFRFIIPYVEFSRQTKGARPILLDSSVLIDGRIADVALTGVFESQLVVPQFIVAELQAIADSADRLKRNRGRRGLDVLARLRAGTRAEVILYESAHEEGADHTDQTVDQRLINLAKELAARVLTNDYNLNKVAQLGGVDVINLNELSNALKPVVLPGERMNVMLVKAGEEPGQGVGYLSDGTMVVVEQGRSHLNEEVEFTVTSALQTSAGRMIFGRMTDGPVAGPRRVRPRQESPSTSTPPIPDE